MSYEVTFCEAVGVCILIVAFLLYKVLYHNNSETKCVMVHMYITLMLVEAIDIVWIITDGNPDFIVMNYIINGVYLFLYASIGFFWFSYCEKHYTFKIYKNKLIRILILLPLAIVFVLVAISPIIEQINGELGIMYGFYRSGERIGEYYRGNMYFIQPICAYGYILVSSILSIYSLLSAKTYRQKNQFIAQSLFNIIPVAFAVLQLFSAPGTPATHLGSTLALVVVYISTQDQLVTRDALTDLPNLYSLDKSLLDLTSKYKDNPAGLYCLMLDIDDFKNINDEHGHLEGDNALRITSKILQDECDKQGAQIARIGGDEFVILIESADYSVVEQFTKDIRERLATNTELSYKISISIGAARYDGRSSGLEFLNQADTELYIYKKAKNIKN